MVKGLNNPELDAAIGESGCPTARRTGAGAGRALPEFDHEAFIAGEMTPVFFGTLVTSVSTTCWTA